MSPVPKQKTKAAEKRRTPSFRSGISNEKDEQLTHRRRRFLHFETKEQPLLPRRVFLRRLAENFGLACALIGVSLLAGMAGYAGFEGMSWVDAFANASMILSGMGPLEPLKTTGGKLFAGCYALYSGLMVIVATGIILAPLIHRLMHQFHVESTDKD
jgi:hypothetical protein